MNTLQLVTLIVLTLPVQSMLASPVPTVVQPQTSYFSNAWARIKNAATATKQTVNNGLHNASDYLATGAAYGYAYGVSAKQAVGSYVANHPKAVAAEVAVPVIGTAVYVADIPATVAMMGVQIEMPSVSPYVNSAAQNIKNAAGKVVEHPATQAVAQGASKAVSAVKNAGKAAGSCIANGTQNTLEHATLLAYKAKDAYSNFDKKEAAIAGKIALKNSWNTYGKPVQDATVRGLTNLVDTAQKNQRKIAITTGATAAAAITAYAGYKGLVAAINYYNREKNAVKEAQNETYENGIFSVNCPTVNPENKPRVNAIEAIKDALVQDCKALGAVTFNEYVSFESLSNSQVYALMGTLGTDVYATEIKKAIKHFNDTFIKYQTISGDEKALRNEMHDRTVRLIDLLTEYLKALSA